MIWCIVNCQNLYYEVIYFVGLAYVFQCTVPPKLSLQLVFPPLVISCKETPTKFQELWLT